jgi:hypothetical protein
MLGLSRLELPLLKSIRIDRARPERNSRNTFLHSRVAIRAKWGYNFDGFKEPRSLKIVYGKFQVPEALGFG